MRVLPLLNLFLLSNGLYYLESGKYHLQYNPDGKFKIVQVTDLHFGENAQDDQKTYEMLKQIFEVEKPDFIAVTGDVVSGFAWDTVTENWYAEQYAKFTKALVESGVPWGLTGGNHDEEADLSSVEVLNLDMMYGPQSMSQMNTEVMFHNYNYVLEIEPPASEVSEDNTVGSRIWFLGSGRENCLNQYGYDCIMPDQISWFLDKSSAIEDGPNKSKGIAFIHIPLPEVMHMHNSFPTYGTKQDNSGCPSVNTGFFQAMKQAGTVQWAAFGHDHNNDFYGEYEGLWLAYGRKSGFGCYGPKGMMRGARVYELTYEPFSIETWVRQEDGSKHTESEAKVPEQFPWVNHAFCSYAEHRNRLILEHTDLRFDDQETTKLFSAGLQRGSSPVPEHFKPKPKFTIWH